MNKNKSNTKNSVKNARKSTSDKKKSNNKKVAVTSKKGRFWGMCSKCRTIFKAQFDDDHDTKVRSIQFVQEEYFPDYHVFGRDMIEKSQLLLDSNRFLNDCKSLEIAPEIVSQHVIFEGAKVLQEVRDRGVIATFGEKRIKKEFRAPLIVVDIK